MTATLVLVGLFGAVAGTYQVIDPGASRRLGLVLLGVGTALAVTGAWVAGRRTARTRYRPDPWRRPEWLVVGVAAVALVTNVVGVHEDLAVAPTLGWPDVPVLPVVGLLLAVLPAWCTPRPPAASGGGDREPAVARHPRTPVGAGR